MQKVSSKVISKDGTIIGFDRFGEGPTVILVDGALEHRAFEGMTQLGELLAQDFTVFHHDRRGRGESTDTKPYAVEREIEDIEAVINVGGGSAFVYGISSGAALAMEATIKIDKIKKLAMYEPPYNDEEETRQAARKYNRKLKELLAEGRLDDALGLFMRLTGMSAEQVDKMHQHPLWPLWKAVAPTLAYDVTVMGEDSSVPLERAASVKVPALIMNGGESYPFMRNTAIVLAKAMPQGEHQILEGQTHDVAPEAIYPVLKEFFLN